MGRGFRILAALLVVAGVVAAVIALTQRDNGDKGGPSQAEKRRAARLTYARRCIRRWNRSSGNGDGRAYVAQLTTPVVRVSVGRWDQDHRRCLVTIASIPAGIAQQFLGRGPISGVFARQSSEFPITALDPYVREWNAHRLSGGRLAIGAR